MSLMYATGGLEPADEDGEEILEINNIKHIVNDRFKSMLRNNIIDWGAFLEIYNNTNKYCDIFDQAVKILDININKYQTENVEDNLLPILEKLYNSPAEHQIMCMMKQYFVYAPMSYAILDCFNMFKNHFENIVELFIKTRNAYIKKHNLENKTNSWDKLIKYWDKKNNDYDLDSSSIILLFINPPAPLKSKINYEINDDPKNTNKQSSKIQQAIKKLEKDISNFYYPGFCPKVPHVRLNNLLTFPLDSFIDAINLLGGKNKFPDYEKIKKLVNKILKSKITKPKIDVKLTLKTPQEKIDKSQLIKWYITEILNNRKSLLHVGKEYEKYYTNIAKKITQITEETKKILKNDMYI